MNAAQFFGILRILLAAGAPLGVYLAAHGIDPTALSDWLAAGVPIAMGAWSAWANTQARLVQVVPKVVPGTEVVVTEAAPEAIKAIAKDPSVKTVNMKK